MSELITYSIYKLICSDTNQFYIGSTKYPLAHRLSRHKCADYNRSTSKYLINPTIELLETIETTDYNIVLNRERDIIEICKKTSNLIVNKNIPNRTHEEYYQAKRDDILEYKKGFYKENKEYIKKRQLLYYYRNHDINKIKNIKVKQLLLNKITDDKKQKHNEYLKEQVLCNQCNIMITRRHKARHNKCDKHIKNCLPSVSLE